MRQHESEEFVTRAINHVRERWCLDDEAVVREWCEGHVESDTPENLVVAIAADVGLIDLDDEAGAVSAARKLMDEYEDLFGDLREVLLARLPSWRIVEAFAQYMEHGSRRARESI